MSTMKQDSIFKALKYTFSSEASQAKERARATDENTLDTELRVFFMRAGMPQAMLEQSKLKEKGDKIVYKAQINFIGGMTERDAHGIAGKMVDGGVNLINDGTTFEGDDRSDYGYMKLQIEAGTAAELRNEFTALQERFDTRKKPSPATA